MLNKKYLLFDLDGTLTDSKPGIIKSIEYGLSRCGVEIPSPDVLTRFIGPPLWDSFMRTYGYTREEADRIVTEYRKHYFEKGMFDNSVYPGIEDLLKSASKTKTLILATSKAINYAEIILKHFKLYEYFTVVCGGELDGTRSNKDEVIRYAADLAGIRDVKDAVMIGDTKYDVLGAAKTGMDCIGVLYGYGSRDSLEEAGASLIVNSVSELSGVLSCRNDALHLRAKVKP